MLTDDSRRTALHLACYQYRSPPVKETLQVLYRQFLEELAITIILCPDMSKFLNVVDNSRIFGGTTPLMYACMSGMLGAVEMLAGHPAVDLNVGIGTALYFACRYSQPEAAMILIEAGAYVCKGEIATNPPYNTYPLNACYVEAEPRKGSIKDGMGKVVEAIQAKGGTKGATGESGCAVAGGRRKNRRRNQKSRKLRKQQQRTRTTTRRQK